MVREATKPVRAQQDACAQKADDRAHLQSSEQGDDDPRCSEDQKYFLGV
jgi:hypothetical protein